jgi:hypothetical protein
MTVMVTAFMMIAIPVALVPIFARVTMLDAIEVAGSFIPILPPFVADLIAKVLPIVAGLVIVLPILDAGRAIVLPILDAGLVIVLPILDAGLMLSLMLIAGRLTIRLILMTLLLTRLGMRIIRMRLSLWMRLSLLLMRIVPAVIVFGSGSDRSRDQREPEQSGY